MTLLTRLTDDLWLDLSQVVSVQTYTAKHTFDRMVLLRTRDGAEHRIVAVQVQPYSRVSQGDQALNDWLAEHLAPALFPDFKARDHVSEADELRKQVRG